ncbi:hypothetical protein AVEN_42385-1, partial [Araneus ventricosus]
MKNLVTRLNSSYDLMETYCLLGQFAMLDVSRKPGVCPEFPQILILMGTAISSQDNLSNYRTSMREQ